jgi:hypothetical protein
MVRGCSRGLVRGVGFFVCLGVCVVLGMIWPQFSKLIEQGAYWPYRAESYQVTYYCSGGEILKDWASITWINDDSKTETGDYSMPFQVSYTMHYGDHAQITARAGRPFQLRCSIKIDSYEWKADENLGINSIVDCSGIVGHK